MLRKEINTNFNTQDPSRALWKIAIVASPQVAQEYRRELAVNGNGKPPTSATSSHPPQNLSNRPGKDESTTLSAPSASQESTLKPTEQTSLSAPDTMVTTSQDSPLPTTPTTQNQPNLDTNNNNNNEEESIQPLARAPKDHIDHATGKERDYFEIAFSFHHCLGDGLSMWAFARTFLKYCEKEYFVKPDLELQKVPLDQDPPPILDNLMNPSLFEVLPGEFVSTNNAQKTNAQSWKQPSRV
jgi:hypothetical protein